MGSRRCGAADGLAVQCIVVHGGVVAVGGVLHDEDDGACILLIDEVLDLLALQSSGQSLDLGGLLIAVLADQNVDVSRRAVLDGQRILNGVQTGRDGVVGVDDGVVFILQNAGHLCSLDLVDVDVERVLLDVVLGGGQAGIRLDLEEAVLLQQSQSAGLVGGVVGHGHADLIQLLDHLGRGGSGRSGAACGGRRTAAGGQGSCSGSDAGHFQKITTRNLRHNVFPLLLFHHFFALRSTFFCALCSRKHEKSASVLGGQLPTRTKAHKTSVVPPWFTAPSRARPRCCGSGFLLPLLTAGRCNGRSRRGLALLRFAPAAPRPFSVPCSLPFSTDRALWKDQCENLLFSSQPFL